MVGKTQFWVSNLPGKDTLRVVLKIPMDEINE